MFGKKTPPVRDTRMKVADEEPTGDEEKDFQEMLTRFKQGIDENIDEADFRSEEHTSELQSQSNLVCRLLLEKKKTTPQLPYHTQEHDHTLTTTPPQTHS